MSSHNRTQRPGPCRPRGRRRPSGVLERVVEPLRAFTGAAGAALVGRLVVARALPGPGGEVAIAREDRHVDADLGEDVLRGARLDAVERAQELNRRPERVQLLL